MKFAGLTMSLLLAACEPLALDGFLYDPLPAPAAGYDLSTRIIPTHEDLFVTTRDGASLHLVYVPAGPAIAPATPPARRRTLVYFHGQSHNIGKSWPRVEYLYPLGHEIYAVDPRGYGRSTGTPSQPGIEIDLDAVHRFLTVDRGVAPDALVYYGRSLGGAFAVHMVRAGAPAALITESAFTSIAALVRDGAYADLPAGFVARSVWDNVGVIAHYSGAYLNLHGTADPYVQFSYARQLVAAHPGPPDPSAKLIAVHGADHGNVPETLGLEHYRELLSRFLSSLPLQEP
jgi:hypothetical protein